MHRVDWLGWLAGLVGSPALRFPRRVIMSWMMVSHDDAYGMETGMVILVPYFVLGCFSFSLFSGQVPP